MKKTSIVTYPAVLIADDADGYTVIFPDIADAVTGGQDLGESLVNATATLGRFLVNYHGTLPVPSTMTELTHRYPADFIQFVAVDLANVATQPVETGVSIHSLDLAK
ncbi:type II toxin-antitoxin system HicB family antitoxin [Levilactobacillus acidifarinae]|uniref:HicB-like antitoxin of toxin-antitoxin system domain-containing protein n=1 Tax=Levilactobacillus acidifarinae DSM 19394 = JCM 15949 TaxID=1423715 RepID=A0A0R1LJ96_9LACO|nr:hypothetical protein [Levilactobacillus acidifarinae]KRK95974.1 hypothetical protein FD25_GL002435 [Levilactobacillus acidifarinae DSM 19394]GEO69279.1 hypothetical protein LAC03_11890 [Levilactobacillus acidifarinae]